MRTFFILFLIMIVGMSQGDAGAEERISRYPVKVVAAVSSEANTLDIPAWAVNIPNHSYVGISSPCASIEEARQQAIDSAIGQILQAMGADYHLSHESVLSGDMNQSQYRLRERLSYTSRWLLNSVQNNIRQLVFRNTPGGHVCFVLVRMRPSELNRLKRLTIGTKLTARIVGRDGNHAIVEVSEANSVGTTLNEYRIDVTKTNSHARLITLFFWKVPESESTSLDGALAHRIFLKNNSERVIIPLSSNTNSLKSILLGSKQDMNITLTGYDEIGRPVSVPVRPQ